MGLPLNGSSRDRAERVVSRQLQKVVLCPRGEILECRVGRPAEQQNVLDAELVEHEAAVCRDEELAVAPVLRDVLDQRIEIGMREMILGLLHQYQV